MQFLRRSFLGIAQIALLGGGAVLLAGAVGADGSAPSPVRAEGDVAKLQVYQTQVQPILQANCLRCHGGMNRRGGYSMATRALVLEGGKHGVAVVPGKPDESLLVKLIGTGPMPEEIKPMPLKGKLTDADIATIRQWVADGAVMDR